MPFLSTFKYQWYSCNIIKILVQCRLPSRNCWHLTERRFTRGNSSRDLSSWSTAQSKEVKGTFFPLKMWLYLYINFSKFYKAFPTMPSYRRNCANSLQNYNHSFFLLLHYRYTLIYPPPPPKPLSPDFSSNWL